MQRLGFDFWHSRTMLPRLLFASALAVPHLAAPAAAGSAAAQTALAQAATASANSYLAASDEQPATADFQGSEWGDDIDGGESPLRMRVITTRLAALSFGSVFRIEFVDVGGGKPRAIPSLHLLALPSEIAILADADIAATLARLRSGSKAPTPSAADLRAISRGSRTLSRDANSESKLSVVGDRCTYRFTHKSGHFTTWIWQRGVGLIEIAQGRGARADGFRLRRIAMPPTPSK